MMKVRTRAREGTALRFSGDITADWAAISAMAGPHASIEDGKVIISCPVTLNRTELKPGWLLLALDGADGRLVLTPMAFRQQFEELAP
jgi:hypothetical protein